MTFEPQLEIPQEVRQRYLERRQKDIEVLQGAVKTHTFEEFKRIGHQLKGNAASFGYLDLEKLAIQLEEAGQKQDLKEAKRQLDLLQIWLKQTLLRQSP